MAELLSKRPNLMRVGAAAATIGALASGGLKANQTSAEIVQPPKKKDSELGQVAVEAWLASALTEQGTGAELLPIIWEKDLAPHRHRQKHRSQRIWYGKPAYFSELDSSGRHNAAVIYEVGRREHRSFGSIGCTENIAYKESGIHTHDPNPASDADGIPQANPASKMASAGPDWQNNPTTQVRWMYRYEDERYGSPCNAWDFWQGHSYY